MTNRDLSEAEIAFMTSHGVERLSVADFCARFAALGYTVDRSDDCKSMARYMTGARAGQSYPSCTTGINESDTGLRALNIHARRDSNFDAMQRLRGEIFAVNSGGWILSV